MKIIVIGPKACSESAKELAQALGSKYENPFDTGRYSFNSYDVVFNYGCGYEFRGKKVINLGNSVRTCVNKISTLKVLQKAKVPCLNFVVHKRDIPKGWEWITVRNGAEGRNGDGIDFVKQGDTVPDADFYTEYFWHKYEYRVVVFKGIVVARYYKKLTENHEWRFMIARPKGFEAMDEECVKSARALNIDYVGFDVLANTKKDFRICEANSGPMLTEEVKQYIKNYFRK